MFLNEATKNIIPGLGRNLCVLYGQLSAEAFALGKKLWKFTPKFHLFLHLCEWQVPSLGNPRFWWTYSDEDLVGMLIEVAQTCHPSTMAQTALFKWLLLAFEE